MADDEKTTTPAAPARAAERSAARDSQSRSEATPDEPRYSPEALQEDARSLLGVSSHAVAGALYGETAETFTLDEAKGLVEAFLTREVS